MLTEYPIRQALSLPALVAAILLASGCSAPPGASASAATIQAGSDPAADADTQDSGGGLPTKDEAGVGTKDDSGLGTKDDSGLGTKDDSGLGTKDDSGVATNDGGGTVDAGSASDAGSSAPPDAGNEMDDCLSCAERRGCMAQVNECLHSPDCVDEGKCDLACLTSSPFGAPNPHCIESCAKSWDATEDLLAAVTCGFHVCPAECLRPLVSCGGDAGAGHVEPSQPGCLHPLAAVSYY
jgi:hypothetical protein